MSVCNWSASLTRVRRLIGGPISKKLAKIQNFAHSSITARPSHKIVEQSSTLQHSLDPALLAPSRDEISARRFALMSDLRRAAPPHQEILVVVPAAYTSFSGPDVPHPFRQESNFFYLTGFCEKGAVLVMRSRGEAQFESTLFVEPKNPHEELWEGPRAGLNGALELTGVEHTGLLSDLKPYLQDLCQKSTPKNMQIFYDPSKIDQMVSSLGKTLLSPEIQTSFKVQSPYEHIHRLRWVKSKAEQNLLRASCQIASNAFARTMEFSRPDINENVLWAKMDFECKMGGAQRLAYPPVVAGGCRANTIHYLNNDKPIPDGQLVLMDAGCEFGGYASDITRCWPVSGQFSPAQRQAYEMLYDVQIGLIRFAENMASNLSLRSLFVEMLNLLGRGLERLGVKDGSHSSLSLADKFCPHHVSHYLGLDVHDTETVSKSVPLKPGVVITIEPGLYFQHDDKMVPHPLRGIGLRIEDDILITENGVELLSKNCPKHIDDIEKLCVKNV